MPKKLQAKTAPSKVSMAKLRAKKSRGPRQPAHLQSVDLFIGNRIRELRVARGITQEGLANLAGLSHQQIQKYETAHNRVSAARAVELAAIFHVPVTALLPGDPANVITAAPRHGGHHRKLLLATDEFNALPGHLRQAVRDIIHTLHQAHLFSAGQAA